MGITGDPAEEAVQNNKRETSANRGKERSRPIDRTRKDRRQDDEQNGIERSFLGEGTFFTHANHYQGREKDDHAAERHLGNGKFLRLESQPEKWTNEIIKRIHI